MQNLFYKILLLIVLAGFFAAPPASADEPVLVVARFQDGLLGVMKVAKQSSVQARYDMLLPLVQDGFHIPVMVRIAVGAYWDNATDDQRQRLIDAFQRINVATLAALVDGYDNQRFERLGDTAWPHNTRLVNTRLVSPDGEKVRLSYIARPFGAAWKLVDAIVDSGISELSVRRSEYQRVLATSGADGLIKALNGKADALLSSSSSTQPRGS